MRTIIAVHVVLFGLALSVVSCSSSGTPAETSAEPSLDFVLRPLDPADPPFRFSDARGRYVVLHFLLETACPRCANYTRDYLQMDTGPDVLHVFVKPDSEDEIKRWMRKYYKPEFPDVVIYQDPGGQLAKRLNVPFGYKFHKTVVHYPALILFDPAGEEIYRYVGRSTALRCPPHRLAEELSKHRAR